MSSDLRRWMMLCEMAGAELQHGGSFKAKDSKLDYEGVDFDRWRIMDDGKPIGEVTVQRGRTTATIRNIIIHDAARTGQGIGKQVYTALAAHYRGKTLRSSFSINRAKDMQTTGLSTQAIHLWDSLVMRGLAAKRSAGDRFYYEML